MDSYINQSTVGQFILDGETYFGNLTLDDSVKPHILLTLYLPEGSGPIPYRIYPSQLQGVLYELTTVTLLDCMFLGSGSYTQISLHGGHAISGELTFDVGHALFSDLSHLDASQSLLNSLEFSITNSNDLFDFSSFTQIINANEQSVKGLVQRDIDASKGRYALDEDISQYSFGDSPAVLVYTGADILSTLEIDSGELGIRNNPNFTISSNNGFKVENNISCCLKFGKLKGYWEVVEEVACLKQLFELILGQKQSIESYKLEVNKIDDTDVFQVFRAVDQPKVLNHLIHPADRLVHVESEEKEFSIIINNWLSSQEEWKFARNYYSSIFEKHQYDSDTLVKLSNMFDLIPDSAYGKVTVDANVSKAAKSCRAIFKDLPFSLESESILLALKRIGQKTLKHKIRNRYEVIQNSGFVELDNIDLVINQSVDCRNFFVHGGNNKFDYFNNPNEFRFFIDTLIFIYGVSEMIQNGWTFSKWKPSRLNGHLFSIYVINYDKRLEGLKTALDYK